MKIYSGVSVTMLTIMLVSFLQMVSVHNNGTKTSFSFRHGYDRNSVGSSLISMDRLPPCLWMCMSQRVMPSNRGHWSFSSMVEASSAAIGKGMALFCTDFGKTQVMSQPQ